MLKVGDVVSLSHCGVASVASMTKLYESSSFSLFQLNFSSSFYDVQFSVLKTSVKFLNSSSLLMVMMT